MNPTIDSLFAHVPRRPAPSFVRKSLLIAAILYSCVSQAVASAGAVEITDKSLLREISASSYWRKLLHYKTNLILSGYRSDITDPAFFLSEQGRVDPYQELIATIETFKKDSQVICRFPARYHWLSQKYGAALQLQTGRLQSCTELEEWRKSINPGSATLIFPAAYLNGPSSMFGHTLLRIEPDDERANLPLITYAINYAANVTQQDNNVLFAFKGIFGGYPGVMAIVPYHEKIKEYGEIENRDIWEYRLDLDKEEILQMMRHAWELKDLRSAYYFFDINCSYLILNLIEVAREDIDLTSYFRFKVIPVDTVRVVNDSGLVANVEYRPAASTQLAQRYEVLTTNQRTAVQEIVDTKTDLNEIKDRTENPIEYARILEIAYDTFRYRAFQTPEKRDENAALNLRLLQARSQIDAKSIWPEIIVPEFKADQGHKSARFAMGYRRSSISDEHQNQLLLKIRPAYHDLLDPDKGYPFGAQINFMDFTFRYNEDDGDTDLEQLTVIDILSLTPVHDLFDPISWRVDFSYENREFLEEGINILQVTPGFGKSVYLTEQLLGYALLNSTLEYSPDYTEDYALGLGLQSGILFTKGDNAGLFELEADRMFSGQMDTRFTVQFGLARHIDTNLSVRLISRRVKLYREYFNQAEVNLNWYF